MNDDFLIECMENEIESSYFDFKKDLYDFSVSESKQAFLIDVLSFANSHSKGDKYIITGIKLNKDNTRVFNGIKESKIKDGADYQSLINDNIEPNIIIEFRVIEYNLKKYGIFKISGENRDQPYMFSKKYNNAEKGFIRIRKGQKNEFISRRDLDLFYKEKNHDEFSNIFVKGIINKKISNEFAINKYNDEFDIEKAKKIILNKFEQIKNIKIIEKKGVLKFGEKLIINEKTIYTIKNYAKENGIKLTDSFFDIGNITYFSLPYSTTNYYGDASEKKKYNLICGLNDIILITKGLNEYYKKINKIYYTEMIIQNNGKKYDEDIEVTLKIRKSNLLKFCDFPVPSEEIIEKILDENIINKYLENNKLTGINTYTSKYPKSNPIYPVSINIIPTIHSVPDYESYVDYYIEYINSISDYEIESDEKYYYVKFNQKEIKPNESIFFPSRIIFKKIPDFIEYEIKSKHNPDKKIGKIKLKK